MISPLMYQKNISPINDHLAAFEGKIDRDFYNLTNQILLTEPEQFARGDSPFQEGFARGYSKASRKKGELKRIQRVLGNIQQNGDDKKKIKEMHSFLQGVMRVSSYAVTRTADAQAVDPSSLLTGSSSYITLQILNEFKKVPVRNEVEASSQLPQAVAKPSILERVKALPLIGKVVSWFSNLFSGEDQDVRAVAQETEAPQKVLPTELEEIFSEMLSVIESLSVGSSEVTQAELLTVLGKIDELVVKAKGYVYSEPRFVLSDSFDELEFPVQIRLFSVALKRLYELEDIEALRMTLVKLDVFSASALETYESEANFWFQLKQRAKSDPDFDLLSILRIGLNSPSEEIRSMVAGFMMNLKRKGFLNGVSFTDDGYKVAMEAGEVESLEFGSSGDDRARKAAAARRQSAVSRAR